MRASSLARPMLLAVAGALLAILVTNACESRPIHVFGGYAFDATNDCLYPPCAVDVVAGAPTAPCPNVVCWLSPGGIVYITSTACDAPPDYVNETDNLAFAPCVKALAAYNQADAGPSICPASDIGGGGAGGGCY